MSVLGSCSQCDFKRRFSADLGGKFYRCPKCREGVVAVPIPVDPSESEEIPLRVSSSSHEAAPLPRRRQQQAQTQTQTQGDETDLQATIKDTDPPESETAELEARPGAKPAGEEDSNKGQVGTARQILVECGLCGFLVRIPPEFFGKTVHCPECAGNTVFTESTLDPVKDELLDRLAMDTEERRALFSRAARRSPGGALLGMLRGNAFRSFLVGVGLGLVVLLGAWGVARVRRSSARSTAIEQAEAEGWRFGSNADAPDLFHQPWCPALDPGNPGRRLSGVEFQRTRDSVRLHACE